MNFLISSSSSSSIMLELKSDAVKPEMVHNRIQLNDHCVTLKLVAKENSPFKQVELMEAAQSNVTFIVEWRDFV